jgi:mono/diheme cytochrome c family protein
MRQGRRPDGAHYYPAFPYPSFTLVTDADLRDLWAYLRTVAPSDRPSEAHDLGFFFRWRLLIGIWKWLFFTPGPFVAEAGKGSLLNRGTYLVRALGHCGECHTPRNFLGGPRTGRLLAGAREGGDGKGAPNLTPTRLKKWSDEDLKEFLAAGLTPDGDLAGGSMAEVVRNTTSQLTPQDLDALVAYLRSVPPLPEERK